jgi:hypothetical protein
MSDDLVDRVVPADVIETFFRSPALDAERHRMHPSGDPVQWGGFLQPLHAADDKVRRNREVVHERLTRGQLKDRRVHHTPAAPARVDPFVEHCGIRFSLD